MKAYATKRSSTGGNEYLTITILPDLEKGGYSSFQDNLKISAETKQTDTDWTSSIRITANHNLKVCKAIVSILEKSGRNDLDYMTPSGIAETLDQLKYKKVCYHEGMNRYYMEKDFPEGSTYRLEIAGQYEKPIIGKTEAEALKNARSYVLKQLENYSSKKWIDWLEDPKVIFHMCPQTYYEASTSPGNTMNLDITA